MKAFFKIIPLIGLVACASPAASMSEQQVASLSDQQLCDLKNTYFYDQKTEVEIGRRNLNCDPTYNMCRAQGIDPASPAMGMCIRNAQEKAALEQEVFMQQSRIDAQESRMRLERAVHNAQMNRQMNNQRYVKPVPQKRVIQPIFNSGVIIQK